VQSSASPEPVGPVERELDRFPCLLKWGREATSARSFCGPCSSRACSLDLVECILNEARRANACGRRNRRLKQAEES